MKLELFDYSLPQHLIAQQPLTKRDKARLMIVDKDKNKITHDVFSNIGQYVPKSSLFVLNDSKVVPARLWGRKMRSGGKVEVFLLKKKEDGKTYETLMRPLKRIKEGDDFVFNGGAIKATFIDRKTCLARFNRRNITSFLEAQGHIPLPPYIKRKDSISDRKYYQTVYAKKLGSVASPTAGLHFTKPLINKLKKQGHGFEKVTLHINYGTFKPVEAKNIADHKMHYEEFSVAKSTADKITKAKKNGRKIVSVGTTSTRVIETFAKTGKLKGETNLFIYPGVSFRMTDILITNFHLPLSSLLMLSFAFGGMNLMKEAYREAIKRKYRFYSYGDCMVII